MNPEKVVRRGAWVTFGVAGLYLASALINPVAGTALALLFGALGWGILRRQIWAATSVPVLLIGPVFLLLGRASVGFGWSLAIGLQVALAWMPIWAAVTLWRHRELVRFNAAWLLPALAIIFAADFVHPYAVPSGSMANTILPGDYILTENFTWHLGRMPRAGDVVQVRYPVDPKMIFIKRVVGVPGDRLHIVNKQLYRNGAPVAEPYAVHRSSSIEAYRDNFPAAPEYGVAQPALEMLANHVEGREVVVPSGEYFVLGDNRDDSLDSRYWGFVSRTEIVGSPVLIYASYGLPAQMPSVTGTVLNTRWNRLLKRL